jgi:hypothetical protein
MLEMKDSCQQCGTTLGWQDEALICSYECTWCPDCAAANDGLCRNCEGDLQPRPCRAHPDA